MDLSAEIDAWLEGKTEYVPEIESEELYEHLLQTAKRELAACLLQRAPMIIADEMRRGRTRARSAARRSGPARAFAEDTAEGPPTVDLWLVPFRVDADNRQKVLGEMVGADHMFVADQYTQSALSAEVEAAFHRAVAKKVGMQKTSDVFDPDTYTALRDSLRRGTKAA